MNFEFATASRIIFGAGASSQIPEIWKQFGQKPLFLSGNSILENPGLSNLMESYPRVIVSREPTLEMMEEICQTGKELESDVLISIGGGSVLDAGKAAAALISNPGSVLDYLEVIGKGKPLKKDPLPLIAVPTTAGTGTEVTKNAVLSSPEHKVKVSLRDNRMLPRAAIVDPALTISLPPRITAYTGMDAFAQCLEPFVSALSSPLTDPLCAEGIKLISEALLPAWQAGDSLIARTKMSLASLMGGLALANAKLGAVHGFAGPIGGMFSAPHGAVCAALVTPVVEVNLRALQEREPENPALEKYQLAGKILTGNNQDPQLNLVRWLADLTSELDLPTLADFGITETDFPEIIEKSKQSSSMRGNPITLTDLELDEILDRAL